MVSLGKALMGVAALMFLAGGAVWLLGRFGPGWLPGDIVFRRGNVSVVFPIVTMLVVSVVLTVLVNLFFRR